VTLPAADLGPANPLPPLTPLDEAHHVDERDLEGLPRDMARQIRYAPLDSVLPTPLRDGYGRQRAPRTLDALVLENDRLRATVLPGLGGRVVSLLQLSTGRELLYRNPVFQPANFALNGAWYSGGIEWNIGATGHTTLSCAPLHAARVTAPDGGEMLRLWEWERLRDLPFQVDLWLPDGSDFLYVGVRVRNPHDRPAPVYWWSNIAVPEECRVLAPADEAWQFGYERRLRRVPVPEWAGADRSYPLNSPHAADYFYELPEDARRWIAALDDSGHGLVQTSTAALRGRKLFVWGARPGGRRWQEWLTEPGTGGYCEIQAGLARTQLEHVRLDERSEFSWLEAYGPLAADADAVHGADWAGARAEVERRLDAALPHARVAAAYEAWLPCADTEPGEVLAVGSGWGALEVLRAGEKLPGTPFGESTLGEAQEPWVRLSRSGALPEPRVPGVPGESLVAPHWRDMLETAPAGPSTEYHLGVAQWHAGDRAQAVRSWERALRCAAVRWPLLRCLAVADRVAGDGERAAERYAEAFDELCGEPGAGEAVVAALGREALEALLGAGRVADARGVWERLPERVRERGRFRLLGARLLLAEGDRAGARAVFDGGVEVPDLREGEEVLGELWARVAGEGEPLPARYDFRMRAGGD
jgi:tetratricopeptide (TPR) repeat protein